MKTIVVCLVALLSLAANAVERKPYDQISINDLTQDTQVQASAGDYHFSMAWWIPFEHWAIAFSKEESLSEQQREDTLEILKGYSMIAVMQSDVSAIGTFFFYEKEEVQNKLHVTFETSDGDIRVVIPEETPNDTMQVLLAQITPVLRAAMGNAGENMHFFVFKDQNEKQQRILDPYQPGVLKIDLSKRDGESLGIEIETPLNALFMPRYCPNGKPAHISWQFCPWSGEKLQ